MVLAGNTIALKNIMYICKRRVNERFLMSNLNLKPYEKDIDCMLTFFCLYPHCRKTESDSLMMRLAIG